jgi:hypothetical protein
MTVKSGDNPLIVCTRDTGIRDVAAELQRWPPTWNMARGRVVIMRDLLGGRIPYFSTGIDCFSRGYLLARAAKKRHHDDTKANCIKVRVKGFGSAVRIALEEVFVKIEAMYHMPQSIYIR